MVKSFYNKIAIGNGDFITVAYFSDKNKCEIEVGNTHVAGVTQKYSFRTGSMSDYEIETYLGKGLKNILVEEFAEDRYAILQYIGEVILKADALAMSNRNIFVVDSFADLISGVREDNFEYVYTVGSYKVFPKSKFFGIANHSTNNEYRLYNKDNGSFIDVESGFYIFEDFIYNVLNHIYEYNPEYAESINFLIAEWATFFNSMKSICKSEDRKAIQKHYMWHIIAEKDEYLLNGIAQDVLDEIESAYNRL